MNYQLFHTIDQNPETNNHLAEIMQSIEKNGWQGLPLVAVGDKLLNGCHRATACMLLGTEPTVYDITSSQADDDEYINELWWDLGNANGTDDVVVALSQLVDEGLVEQAVLDIMTAELYKEK